MSEARRTELMENQSAYSGDAIIATNYPDNYSILGKHMLINYTGSLGDSATRLYQFDLSAVTAGKKVIFQPMIIKSSATYVKVELFEAPTHTGGSTVTPLNLDFGSAITVNSVIKLNPSGGSDGTLKITDVAFASTSVISAQSVSTRNVNIIILDPTKKYLVKITNTESGSTNILFNLSFYEV